MAITPVSKILITPPPSQPPTEPLPAPPLTPRLQIKNPARVLVGPEKKEFVVDRDLLAAASPSFSEGLDASAKRNKGYHTPCIWLDHEAPAMFELFVVWLHHRSAFRRVLDSALSNGNPNTLAVTTPRVRTSFTSLTNVSKSGNPDSDTHAAQKLHWGLVRLHLFAARLSLLQLQDAAMDALQDLYLRRDWDVTPRLIRFLYGKRAEGGMRLRRWAVAMVAWQLAGASSVDLNGPVLDPSDMQSLNSASSKTPDRMADLFARHPEFTADYETHLRKMTSSGLDVCIKNPQLRIPANRMRSEERMFAFRQCSFHSHRAAVGERECPHVSTCGSYSSGPQKPTPLVVLEMEPEQPKLGRVGLPDPRMPRSPLVSSREMRLSVGMSVWV